MTSLKTYINELLEFLSNKIRLKRITEKDALTKHKSTGYYPIRIASIQKDPNFLDNVLAHLHGIQIDGIYPKLHSSKFSSICLVYKTHQIALVIASGANNGETFELELFKALQQHIHTPNDLGKAVVCSLQNIGLSNRIVDIKRRSGNTRRSGALSAAETGKIVADVILRMDDGTEHYVSVKDTNGSTVANFGIADCFKSDFEINRSSASWNDWIMPFGVCPDKIELGLKAYLDRKSISWNDIEFPNRLIDNRINTIFRKLWGMDYIYLRRISKDSFDCKNIDSNFLDSILDEMRIIKIVYPSDKRKQLNIFCESKKIKLGLELRNSSGKVRPRELKMRVLNT